ncbi:hypothetical protein, partial [Salmonella sp. ZJLS19Sal_0414]|uniref:hypothetical protein n=1 Tax=Salmonella sp. ZJLS19Sal_0414 TaxID=3159623 RepID=UPI00397E9BB9
MRFTSSRPDALPICICLHLLAKEQAERAAAVRIYDKYIREIGSASWGEMVYGCLDRSSLYWDE